MDWTAWRWVAATGAAVALVLLGQGCVDRATPSQPGDGAPADLPAALDDLLPPPDRRPPRPDRTLCGNGLLDGNEQCDGNDLGGKSCTSLGLMGKLLACRPDCTFDTRRCGWLKALPGIKSIWIHGIAATPDGGAVVVGVFSGTVTLGKTTLTARGKGDLFVARLTPSGAFSWAVSGGGSWDDLARAVTLDQAGNIYVTGNYYGPAQFGAFKLPGQSSFYDILVLKLSPAGKTLWAVGGNGEGVNFGSGIAVDGKGEVTISGAIGGAGSLGGKKYGFAGDSDALVARISPAGKVLWAVSAGGSDTDRGLGVAMDSAGNSYLAGTFWGTARFGSAKLTSAGVSDFFVSKLDTKGAFLWIRQVGGKLGASSYNLDFALDAQGYPLLAGGFFGTVQVGGKSLTSSGRDDLLLVRLTPKGAFQWAVSAGGSDQEEAKVVATAGDRITLAGTYRSTIKLGSSTLAPFDTGSYTQDDLFVAGLDTKGTVLWAARAGAKGQTETVGALAMDPLDNAYLIGTFSGKATFANAGTLTSPGGGGCNFIWKIGRAGP